MTRGFRRRHGGTDLGTRLPPGQYVERGFPVLSAGPTPRVPLDRWDFAVHGAVAETKRWTWDEFHQLPREQLTKDIHCVTSWSKFDTLWEGVSVDAILDGVELQGGYAVAECDGGYTTNLALDDLTGGKAWIVDVYDGKPLPPEHGGPARLLVPHLYFWKSAKWVRRLRVTARNEPGFWENLGYHDRGDPWREQRYAGD
jgi:DMSO/TMAO reductase YedYZ molybdopterin-dependent catalytic subunit